MSSSPDALEWCRSSRCSNGACVEVARAGDVIKVRRSGDPDAVVLTIQASEWQEFLTEVRAGRRGTG